MECDPDGGVRADAGAHTHRADPAGGFAHRTLQGGYVAVDQLCEALRAALAVHERGTASGDQEKEVDLQLRRKW
jgi:hypothetical protein